MKRKTLNACLTGLGLVCMTACSYAQANEVQYNFSGFGTVGGTHSSNTEADFRGSLVFPTGAGATRATAYGIDTRLGLQGSAKISPNLSAIVQVVTDRRYDNRYRPEIEWANFKYDVDQNWYVRAGRVVAPVFMYSEQRNVAFSLPEARLPYEAYSLNPITHMDGADVGGRTEIGGGQLSVQITAGRGKLRLSVPIEVSGSAAMLNTTYEKGSSTYRFGYGRYRLDFMGLGKVAPFFEAYSNAVNNMGISLGYPPETANVKFSDVKAKIIAAGYAYDAGNWLLQSEYIVRRSPGVVVQDANAWYVMGGYRMGKFTPFVSVSQIKSKEPAPRSPAVGTSGMAALSAYIINAVDADYNEHNEQSRVALGMRYDFYRNLALKVQLDHIRKPAAPAVNNGLFELTTTNFATNKASVNLLTVNLDFVF
jgi:hypothetical protein